MPKIHKNLNNSERPDRVLERRIRKTGGQAEAVAVAARENRAEGIARMKRKLGEKTHAIHIGRPHERAVFRNGRFVWEKLL